MDALEGAILVGGRSRRMGRDKKTLKLSGRPIFYRIGEAMAPLTRRVRLIGTEASEGPYTAQRDLHPGLGPLSGIHAAIETSECSAVLVVACDLPFVTTEFLRALAICLTEGVDAAAPRESGRPVPVCAIYRTTCLAPLEAYLARGELAAGRFVETLKTAWLEGDALRQRDPRGLCLKNLNTPEDYEEAVTLVDAD